MIQQLKSYAIVVDPLRDNIAVAKVRINSGTKIEYDGNVIKIQDTIPKGHRFALTNIESGELVRQYGQPFGTARGKGIPVGMYVGNEKTFSNDIPDIDIDIPKNHQVDPPDYLDSSSIRTFEGYKRKDGRVGTRNYFLIVPVSFCANGIASKIERNYHSVNTPGIDGIVALNNNSGCGCGEKRRDIVTRVLINYAKHPNVGGVLFVENGCEQTCFPYFRNEFGKYGIDKPVEWLSLQAHSCNLEKTVIQGENLVSKHLDYLKKAERKSVPISSLVLGTECGGSDAFSGLSGNLALGELSDLIVRSHGTTILSEIPEFWGAHDLLALRGKNKQVVEEILGLVYWYWDFADRNDESLGGNPSPGNIKGGLINIIIKSLGATIKGGTTRIEGTSDYGELITQPGLNIMQGPGNDIESITGLVASGATLVGFTSGRGTSTGNPIVPIIKIANTDTLYEGADIFDYNAGHMVSKGKSKKEAGADLLDLAINVASGQKTRSEFNECAEFIMWLEDSISL